MNSEHLISKLKRQVDALQLNLKGRTVLTEAASGAYIVTPLIAAMAGAKVFAFSKTTRYGQVDDVFSETKMLAKNFSDFPLNIHYIENILPEVISQADIITNSGHLRPLTAEWLCHARADVVIPLMYEAWEWRDADMDIQYIKKRGFKVGATNERHPDVDVFNFLGDMALKQIFDAGICPYRNRFILLCNNDFGPFIAKTLAKICDGLAVIDKDSNQDKYNPDETDWLGGFPEIKIPEKYKTAEAVIFTAYPFDQTWIGHQSPIRIDQISSQISDPLILRFAGDLEESALQMSGVRFFPAQVKSGHMGILPSAIGFDPIIRLQSGGLKAGEALLTGNHNYKNIKIVELL